MTTQKKPINGKEDAERVSMPAEEQLQSRLTPLLALTAGAAAFGSSFPHGWNTGVLNAPSEIIRTFLNESWTERTGSTPSVNTLYMLWCVTVAIYLVGGMAGAFAAGWMANKMGRRNALLINTLFGFVAALLFGLCNVASSFEMLILARLIVGFGCGAGSGLVPMYLTESAPVNIRGAMGVVHQFMLTCGILMSQIVGMRQLLGTVDRWPYLLAATAIPCAVSLAILPFCPDSPRYLYSTDDGKNAAIKALKRFREPGHEVKYDIQEMEAERQASEDDPAWSVMELLRTRYLRTPTILLCALACAQQLSGINAVFYYSGDIFLSAGIPKAYTQYAVLGTGFVNVLMTAISVPLMEKAGRRVLLLGGMMVMVGSALLITVALNTQSFLPWMSYVSLICVIGFVIGFAIGLGSIPQFLGGELFKQGPRPPAMSLAGFFNWLCNFLVGLIFPFMSLGMGAYSFVVFIAIVVLFWVFFYFKMPETKGETYETIYKKMGISHTATGEAHSMDEKKPLKEMEAGALPKKNGVAV